MTSTNEGKDVKSNQTSGHKGKSYYIDLYKTLENAISDEDSLEARTSHVCEAWRRVYSLYQNSTCSTHPHLLSWLQRHTAHTVLQSKWAESKNEHARLTTAIDALVAEATAASAGREQHPWEQLLLQRAAWFKKTLSNPWGHPVLKSLIDPNAEPVTDQQILEWLVEEHGIVLVTRLRQLVSAGNCDDLALLLAAAVMDRARAAIPRRPDDCADDKVEEPEDTTSFVAVLERDASFTVDVWELLTDIELVLLLKTDKRPRCIELAKLTPLRHGYAVAERLRGRLAAAPLHKKLWRHAKEVATIVTQVIITRCMVLTTCTGVGRDALYSCARSLARLVPSTKLQQVANTFAAVARTARHLYTFCAALDAQCSAEMKPFICELYVRAITTGMNELEQLKLSADKASEARSMEQSLASWFTKLGGLLSDSGRLRAECALTAFSVHPARNYYERVAAMTPPARLIVPQEPTPETEETPSEFGSWANDSRTQSNLVKTSETLQMKKTEQHQANVLSMAILTEGETLGLEPELCQDLAVLLSGPRVKTLSWDMDRQVLLSNCQTYMERTHGGTRAVTTELRFLNLDPAAYRHLPEEDDDETDLYYGIEKGYEHEVQLEDPEEIWQNAFFDPEQTESANDSEVEKMSKKKVRVPLPSSDDEDPLSTIADAKREKKLAKEKSKEHRRKKSHKRDSSKDGTGEQSKDKDKKTKKGRKKEKSEQTTGSLTSLLGMKVSTMPSQVQDGQKKVRKKKERRRDTMFSYVSVTDGDYDSQAKSQPISDPNIVVDGVFSMDELKSPERTEDSQNPIDTKPTLTKSDSVKVPVINDFKIRTIVNPKVTTSLQSDASRARSPFCLPNQLVNRHVIGSKVKSSISKLLQFRRNQCKKPRTPAPSQTQVSDKTIPNQTLIGMKIYNPEEIPKVYPNKKQQLEAIKNEVHDYLNANQASSSVVHNMPKISYSEMSLDKLHNSPNLNVQKPNRQYTNVPRDIIQNVFNECQKINNEYLQHSPFKNVQQSNNVTSPTPSVIQTNYSSPAKSDTKPYAINLIPPKPTMTQQSFHKSMQNLSTDIKHEVSKKPLLINDPNYFSSQHTKTSQISPRILSNTCIKPPSQTAMNSQQYTVNIIKEDLIKSSQRHTELSRTNMPKGSVQNLSSQISNLKSDIMKYRQKQLSSSMQNVSQASSSCSDGKKLVFTPSDILHGIASQSKQSGGKPDLSYTSTAYNSDNSSSASRCNPFQGKVDSKSQQTPKHIGLNTNYQDFFNELAKTINAANNDPDKNVTISLNKDVKVTPVLTASKRADAGTPQCAKQTIQQKKTENAPNTFSRLSYMHKNKQNESKVNLTDAVTMELNKNIMDHKISKAKYMTNEVTISRVTKPKVQDQGNVIRKNEQKSSKLQKSCPVLSGMLDSPVKNSQTFSNLPSTSQSADSQKDREHADLLLLLRQQPFLKTNSNSCITSRNEPISIKTSSNIQTQVDLSAHLSLIGTKVKNINTILNTPTVKKESTSDDDKPEEWKQVMNAISALKTEPLGPNALDMVLKKDYKRQPLSSSRPSTSEKSIKTIELSALQNNPSDSKKREHTSSKSSVSRKSSTEKPLEISKKHKLPEIVQKSSLTDMQRRLDAQNKLFSSNTSKNDDTFISGIPNSAYDMLGDLMDDDLRQELGELSSDEEGYKAPNVPLTKVKSNANIPKTSSTCKVTDVAKVKPPIDTPKTCKNESTSSLIGRTILNTITSSVIANNASQTDSSRLPENMPTVVCSNIEQPPTATVISEQIVQHTNSNFMPNNTIDPSCFVSNIEPANVIIASLPVPVPAQPVVVIRQDLVYDPYPMIRIHESQVAAGLCSVNPNVYAINNAPNIAVYQTTQFAAPVINPVIIGNATTTSNVSDAVAMSEPQDAPDATSTELNTQEPDITKHVTIDRLTEDDNKTLEKPPNHDFNMNRNCERKVLSQVQEKHPTENVDKDSLLRRLSVDDKPVKTNQDEDRIKLKRQNLMNREISHACFHPPIPLSYTPLSTKNNLGELLKQEKSINGTIKPNLKSLPNTPNGMNKYVTVTGSRNDVEANNENIESTEPTSNAKGNKKTCRRIWLRSSRINDTKVLPETQSKIRLNRNKRKIKVSESDIHKITNFENENKDSVKTPTRISSRILNKNKPVSDDSNKPFIPAETQHNCLANNGLIDFEEELSGSKILKTAIIRRTSEDVHKDLEWHTVGVNKKSENNKSGDVIIEKQDENEDVPALEPKKLTNSLEPTVVIEKLENTLGNQLLKPLAKAAAHEPKDVAIKILNQTALKSNRNTNNCVASQEPCMANTIRVSSKYARLAKLIPLSLEKTSKSSVALPMLKVDKIKSPAIVNLQKVPKQTDTTTDLATTLQKLEKDLQHDEKIQSPTLKNTALLETNKIVPASEVANKVVTRSDESRTMVQNISLPSNDNTQINQSVATLPLNIQSTKPVQIEQKVQVSAQKEQSLYKTATTSVAVPKIVSLEEVNNVIQNMSSLLNDDSLKTPTIDPPLKEIRHAQTKPGEQVGKQTTKCLNDMPTVPKIVPSDNVSSVLDDKTEKVNQTDAKVTKTAERGTQEVSKTIKNMPAKVKPDSKLAEPISSSKTAPIEMTPEVVNNDSETQRGLLIRKEAMIQKEILEPIAVKDDQRVLKQSKTDALQIIQDRKSDLKINSSDMKNIKEINVDPVISLLCDENIIEVPDDDSSVSSKDNGVEKVEHNYKKVDRLPTSPHLQNTTAGKDDIVSINESKANNLRKKATLGTDNMKQEGARSIKKGDLKIEELPVVGGKDSDQRLVRITLPTGKAFKATIYGNIQGNLDTLFSQPAVKSLLAGQTKDGKRYTINYKQISKANKDNPAKILDSKIQEINIKELPVDTVNLISDDEEEAEIRNITTEFGKYKTNVDQDTCNKHQMKFDQKCVVKLSRENIFKSNKTKPKTRSCPSVATSLLTRTKCKLLFDAAVATEINPEIDSKTEKKDDELPKTATPDMPLNKQEMLQTPPLDQVTGTVNNSEVIEIDDSSNDSVVDLKTNTDNNVNAEPVEKILELKSLLLQDLGVEALAITNKTKPVQNKPAVVELKNALLQDLGVVDDSPIIDITTNDDDNEVVAAENITVNDQEEMKHEKQKQDLIKDCVLKLTRCDNLIKRHQLMKTMKKCYVRLERIDNCCTETITLPLNSETDNKEIDEYNQDNGEEIIEFDVEETFSSPQLSRYPSLSILNNWDDEISPNKPCCSSPVMELYDVIVKLQTKDVGKTELLSHPKNNISFSCDSEWRLTKLECRMQEIVRSSQMSEHQMLSDGDSIVSDNNDMILTFNAPRLSTITLQFFKDNPDVIYLIQSVRKMRRMSKTRFQSNKLKRKTDECVKNTVASKILKLGTLALNAFNSSMTASEIPILNRCEAIKINIIDKSVVVDCVFCEKNEVEEHTVVKETCVTTTEEDMEKVEQNAASKISTITESNQNNEPEKSETNLKEHGDDAQELYSNKRLELVDEQIYIASKEIYSCNEMKESEKSPVFIGTEVISKRVALGIDNYFSSHMVLDNAEEGSIQDDMCTFIEATDGSETEMNDKTCANLAIKDAEKASSAYLTESQLVDKSVSDNTNDVNRDVRDVVDDMLDKISHTLNISIQETTRSDLMIHNHFEVTVDTCKDIVQIADESHKNSSTVAQDETAIDIVNKSIAKSNIQPENDCKPKDEALETETEKEPRANDKVTSLPLNPSPAESTNKESPVCANVGREQTEIEEASNFENLANIEQYDIPIEHLFDKVYEVEIVDTELENGIGVDGTSNEPSPDVAPINNPLEVQSHDSEIWSPVFIDNKEIAFNYHDYTKRSKQDSSVDSEYAVITSKDKCVEILDNDSLNEENALDIEGKNTLSTLKVNIKHYPCSEEILTDVNDIEINSITENSPPKSETNCKYELIQNDDWLTVIKTESEKDDNETSDEIEDKTVVASLCTKNTTIKIKGFEYDDVYIFPLSESASNTSSDSQDGEVLKDNRKDDIHDIDYSVTAPKVTYRKSLKRKIDMKDIKVAEKRYRKGKNIDCPKLTAATMAKSAYAKEYKRLLEYCSSVKFSYSRSFHKELVEVDNLTSNWPIKSTYIDVPNEVPDEHLFKNSQETVPYLPDPATQTFAEEISYGYENSDATQVNPSNKASEINFNMGFGEGSGRVIQILKKEGESNISAATLSDVKQSQPVFKSVDHYFEDLKTNSDDQIKKIRQHVNFIELRDKVRSFFKKSSVELKSDWLQNFKDAEFKSRFHADEFPFDLCSLDYVEPIPTEAIVQVVQVGQLPVSAAAQNPVTCDPRVTQVSDASPSQCSVDNSPNDDSQSEIKTEYTELTTADLTLPLQEYAQHNQASMNLTSHDNNEELTEQTISLEMEIQAEESPEIKEEMPDIKEEKSNSSDTEFHTLTNATPESVRVNYSFENNTEKSDASSVIYDSSEQNSSETFSQQRHQNGTSEKTDQIAHAMNAAGITTTPENISNTRAHALVNILSQKLRQGSVNNTQTAPNTYSKTTSINAMALQQALAQILPPPLNQTGSSENNQTQSTPVGPQVLHIVQGKNASGNQITLVDNSQQSVISSPNATQVLHIVQNKNATPGQASNGTLTPQANSFSGLSLVDAGLQQGGNQLLHIVNTGNQKTASPQLLKRVNLLTNLANVQGSNEQKMVQFVCKSADGKSIQLNAPHQRSMVLRLQPIETPNVQTPAAKPAESQEHSASPTSSSVSKDSPSQQEIKSRSIYEENYAKFIQNSSSKTPGLEKSTSLPKFNQAFGKPVFQEGNQKQSEVASNNSHLPPVNTNTESECAATDNAINLEHIGQISSPPLLIRKQPAVTTQSQPNIVQQIKQTIAPMNIQTMHGGVIYTRQIPVNIGGGQTINLITVPSTELINDDAPKPQTQTSQGEIEPSIIKIVPQNQTTTNNESTQDESNNHASGSSENTTPTPQPQPVLTQMRIKLPMLSKAPQMVPGARVVRPSFFQIQRNVIGGTNQPVYQQLVLTAAPPLGQQTIRLPQAQTSRPIKVPSESQSSSSESQMSSSTLEQLREFDMVLEQVKERSTVQPSTNTTTNSSFKIHTSSSDTTDGNASSNCSTESTSQVMYSIGNNQPLSVAYVNRKTTVTTPTTSTYVRSPDSSGIADSPTSSTHVQISHTVTTDSSPTEMSSQSKPAKVSSKSKSRPKSTSNPPNTLKLNSIPPKTSSQKPLEDEQTTQRILYILAEYKEQVENSPDKDKPAPRRRSNPPSNPGSSKRKKSSSSRRSGTRDMSPVHGEDTCRTMGSEDSSCGTSQGDCTESCLDSHSPQDSPRKVARKITFDQDLTVTQPRPQPQRNVIVADGQTITVARGTTGKPATAVLMPANYILPVSMVKGGQQIAIVTNRGPKLLTVGGEGGATNALLLQRLIGPAGLKPVLARPGVRHVRLPTAALHNLQAFNLATATTVQPPDSTASPTPGPTPPELSDTRATSSPWTDRDDVKPERGSSPEGSEPWNLPSSADAHEYTYEETVRTDNMDRTVLVVQKKDGTHRQHRLSHVSAAALRHKYAILEHELRLQKSLSEECEDLGVDSPSASELFPEAELLFAASPAHEHNQEAHHSHTPQPLQSSIPQPDMDDQIATDHLIPREIDVNLGLGDVGIVAVSEDGMQATIALDQEEFARSHPNTTFHSEPTDGEVQPFTISGLKGRHITSTIFHSNSAPATVLMAAPQATVISQAPDHGVKYEIENMINSMPSSHNNDMNLSSVLVKDDGLTRFDSILTDSRELHLTNTASAIVHSSGNATQVIRRVCYEDDKRERDTRYLIDEPDNLIAGDDAKMIAEDSSRDATLESMADVDDDRSSPERHAELFWESNSASERSESRRPLDFSSDSDKCCKSPSFDETNSTDSSGVGTHMRLDSVIKEARGRERSGSADGSSADDTHPPLRTYPPKRLYHPLEGEAERSLSGKTRAGERSPDSLEVRRRASGRGVVKRGCHCCNGSPAPPRPKKPRQRKPTLDFNTST